MVASCDSVLGYMLPWVVRKIRWPDYWEVDHATKTVQLLGGSLAERDHRMAETLRLEYENGPFKILNGWRDELYPVYDSHRAVVVNIERAGSSLFGIVIYGVHMTGFVRRGNTNREEDLQIWVARRSQSKQTYPGMLDNTIGGGVSTGHSPFENLLREAVEEASIPIEYVHQHAKVCGTVTYFDIRDEQAGGETGLLQPECIYVYDLEMPADMKLSPGDHEAESFSLWGVEKVKRELAAGKFKTNCALVLLDFLIRRGLLNPEEEADYIEITTRLHRRLEFPVR